MANIKRVAALRRQLHDIEKKIDETPGLTQEYYDLWDKRQMLVRELSLEKGEETALLFDWQFPWDAGAPTPHVVSNSHKLFLMYYLQDCDPAWEGTYIKSVDDEDENADWVALVEFVKPEIFKFGSPNDEVIYNHPLYKNGLEAYQAHYIENSAWKKGIEKINSVHACHRPEKWERLKHYIFTFHDEIFECIADSYKVEVHKTTIKKLISETVERLWE